MNRLQIHIQSITRWQRVEEMHDSGMTYREIDEALGFPDIRYTRWIQPKSHRLAFRAREHTKKVAAMACMECREIWILRAAAYVRAASPQLPRNRRKPLAFPVGF